MACLSAPLQKVWLFNYIGMMKRCKYISESQVCWLRNPLREDGRVFCNPTPAELDRLGYFPLIDSPRGVARKGFVQLPHYRLEGERVVRTWVYEQEKEEA